MEVVGTRLTSLYLLSIVWFSVRARALGSFLGGITAIISGNILGVSNALSIILNLGVVSLKLCSLGLAN